MKRTHPNLAPITMILKVIGFCTLLPITANADWTGDISGEQVLDGDDKGSRIRFEMSNSDRPFSQAVYADYIKLDDSGSGYAIGYDPQYWVSEKFYVFGTGSVQTSANDAVDYTRSLGGGVGVEIINTQYQELSATLGAVQDAQIFDKDFVLDGEDDTTTAVSTFVTLGGEQQISDFFKFGLDLGYSIGESSNVSSATASIKLGIPGGGALVYNYSLQSEKPDVGDTIESKGSSISFQYGF